MRLAIVAAVVLLLAGCQAAQIAHDNAICGTMSRQCVQLYSGGNLIKSIKDPTSLTTFPDGNGVAFVDATGKGYVWGGEFLIRSAANR